MDSSKPSEPVKWPTMKWKTDLVSSCKDLEIKLPNTNKHTTRDLKGILKTPTSPTSSCPLRQDSIYPQNGLSNSTMATSPVSWPMMAHVTHPILSQSMHPLSHQMTHQLDWFPAGSMGCLKALMPSFSKWLSALAEWTTGALPQTSSATENTTRNIRKSIQKSIDSSWMPPLLSKIVPYVNNVLKCWGALKVLLTSKGWVPSLPMPSGAHTSLMMKMTTNDPLQRPIAVGDDSEEEVMKQLLGLVMEDD
jgi:hypothetical protein